MAKVRNDVETLPKISIDCVRCTNDTDNRQTTDGRATAYSERSLKTITEWLTGLPCGIGCIRLNPFAQIIRFLPHDYFLS